MYHVFIRGFTFRLKGLSSLFVPVNCVWSITLVFETAIAGWKCWQVVPLSIVHRLMGCRTVLTDSLIGESRGIDFGDIGVGCSRTWGGLDVEDIVDVFGVKITLNQCTLIFIVVINNLHHHVTALAAVGDIVSVWCPQV